MRSDDHPKRQAWLTALSHMLEAEHGFFDIVAQGASEQERKKAQQHLHRARQAYWDIADNLENSSASPSTG
jgi:uncharacterized damage-inducible protein DinB